jgi:hypothetical protein
MSAEEFQPLDYQALLEGLPNNSVAWIARQIVPSKQSRHGWPTRDAAIAAILDALDEMPDEWPQKELLYRWANTPALSAVVR